GRLKRSDTALVKAIALAQSLGDRALLAAALLHQGWTRIDLSMYREAIVSTERALEIFRQLSDRDGTAIALVQLSNLQVRMGNYRAVGPLIEQALEGINPKGEIAGKAM